MSLGTKVVIKNRTLLPILSYLLSTRDKSNISTAFRIVVHMYWRKEDMEWFLLFSIVTTFINVYSFDPGCSFFNGQCVYNVKLGHEGQCGHSTRAAGDNSASSSGIQV